MTAFPTRLTVQTVALAALASLLGAGSSVAGLQSKGFTLTHAAPNMNLGDVAYDDKHGVYLQVVGISPHVVGRFVHPNGTAIGGPFVISTADRKEGQAPRVAYSSGVAADVFLVTFQTDALGEPTSNIYGQLIQFVGGPNPAKFIGGNFKLTVNTNRGLPPFENRGLAFNSRNATFVVSWTEPSNGTDIFVRLFNTSGQPVTNPVNLNTDLASNTWQGNQNVACDPVSNRCLVVWQGERNPEELGSWGKIINGDSGVPVTGTLAINVGGWPTDQNVIYLPQRGAFLACWSHAPSRPEIVLSDAVGRIVAPDGTFPTGIYPLIATGEWEGVPRGAYSDWSGTVMVATWHNSAYLWATELDGMGNPMPGATFQASSVLPGNGTFGYGVAAGANGQFAAGYIIGYQASYIERYQSSFVNTGGGGGPTPPPPVNIDLSPSTAVNGSWFFAEGVASDANARGFDTYYLINNPNQQAARVRMYLSGENGATVAREFDMPALSRRTISLREQVGTGSFGAVFQSLTPGVQIYPERSMYWGPSWEGSTTATSTQGLSKIWYFAEGSRVRAPFNGYSGEFFSNYFLLFNPTQEAANVSLIFFTDTGQQIPYQLVVGKQSRATVDASRIGGLEGRDFSVKVVSDVDILAERSMYMNPDWRGGTSSIGYPAPNDTSSLSPHWYFAEGVASPNFETYFTVFNPHAFSIGLDVAFLTEYAGVKHRGFTVPAGSRYTIRLGEELPNVGPSSVIMAVQGGYGVLVERSIYWGPFPWVEGSNTTGAAAPAFFWFLPEGNNLPGFDTYLMLSNPNGHPVDAVVTIWSDESPSRQYTETFTLPALSRRTIHMRDQFARDPSARQALNGRAFATRVHSPQGPIIAEHAVYYRWDGWTNMWRSGGAGLGIPQ